MDGCCVDKGGTGCGGRSAFSAMQTKYRQHLEHRVAWFGLLGLLVSCLFDGWMDGWPDTQFFLLCAWLMDGWMGGCMDGRTDGRTDGCCASQGGRGCGGGRSATGWVVLVAWFVGCLVGLLAWPRCCLVGWSVDWHSAGGCVDGRMLCKWGGRSASPVAALLLGWLVAWHSVTDGCMDGWMDFRRFPPFRTVFTQFPEGSEGLVTRNF